MGEEEQAAIMRRIKGEKERVEGQRASGKLQREGLRNQDVYLKAQINELAWERKALKEKAKSGHISADEVMQLRKIEDTMNDIVKKRGEAVALIHESLAADQEHKEALEFCGSHSGKHVNKTAKTGLTPVETSTGMVYFAEAKLVIECKKIYFHDIDPANFVDKKIQTNYSSKDYHRMYIGEITNCLLR